jgi:phage repressor protein C with HTH and peptisase S24 domain
MKIGERTEAEMKRREWSEAELARRASITQPTVHRIIKGESKNPRQDNIQAIAKAFGCSAEWLWTGTGKAPSGIDASQESSPAGAAAIVLEMLKKHGKGLTEEARQKICTAVTESLAEAPSNVITADFRRAGPVGDEIRIAHYDVQGAMGTGKLVHDFPEMFRDVTVSQQHLKELGVTYKDPAHLKLITGDGQSMEPTIQDKDPLIADASIREFSGDGIYAFVWQSLFYIKRLQIKDSDHFKMISDNKHHDPEIIRIDETYIQARILLVWNAQKL